MKKAREFLSIFLCLAMLVTVLASCDAAQGPQGLQGTQGEQGEQGATGPQGNPGRGILKSEIIDGYLWITYTDAPESPVNVGKITQDLSFLDFYPLPDGTYGVMAGNTLYLEEIVIPAEYNGKAVTQILPDAFKAATNLKKITIPDSVTSIGDYAFRNCTSLTSITIPDSVTSIGDDAFSGCSNLNYTEYNNGKYLGNSNNPYIVLFDVIDISATSFTIPNTTKFIWDSAFVSCSKLTEITIPNSVTSIGDDAFEGCTGLTSVTIPDSVTSIGNYAFNGCTSLTSVTIPNSVTSIGDRAFRYCAKLTTINYRGTQEQWNAITKGISWDSDTGSYTVNYNYTGE